MPSFKVKYRTVVEAWTVIDCANESEARDAIERGRFTGSTNIGERLVEIDFVEKTHDKPECWIPKPSPAIPENKGTALMPEYDTPTEPEGESLPDVGKVIGQVMERLADDDEGYDEGPERGINPELKND